MSLVSRQEVENKFCVTRTYGKHGKEYIRWPRSTICLLKCEVKDCYGDQIVITGSKEYGDDWDRFDNTINKLTGEKNHAEINMLENLNAIVMNQYQTKKEIAIETKKYQIMQEFLIEISMIINYSPCIDCARKIIAWKNLIDNKNITIRMHIRFANFYYCHGKINANREGLVNLLQAKIALDVFDRRFMDHFLYDVLKLDIKRMFHHVIRDEKKREERAVRENIDNICLMCLKKKSESKEEETDEEKSLLDQVFSNDDESVPKGIDYETYVGERGDAYLQYLRNRSPLLPTSDINQLTLGINAMQLDPQPFQTSTMNPPLPPVQLTNMNPPLPPVQPSMMYQTLSSVQPSISLTPYTVYHLKPSF